MEYFIVKLFGASKTTQLFFMKHIDAYLFLLFHPRSVDLRWPFWILNKAEYALIFSILSAVICFCSLIVPAFFWLPVYLLYPICLFVIALGKIKGYIPVLDSTVSYKRIYGKMPFWSLFFGTVVRIYTHQMVFNPYDVKESQQWVDEFCSKFILGRVGMPFIANRDPETNVYYIEMIFLNRDDAIIAKLAY